MGTISDKLTYLNTTKSQLKDMINYGLPTEEQITSSTTFREYVSSIFNAFLEALRTPDTLFTNLPKKNGTGAVISLNDTANAPMRIELDASELTQDGTPTPSSPQAVHTISGSNKIYVGLPKEYTQVDYLESSGTQYIDTGIYPLSINHLEFKAIMTSSANDAAFYGANSSGNFVLNTMANTYQLGVGTYDSIYNTSARNVLHNIKIYASASRQELIVDSETLIYKNDNRTIANTKTIYLFGRNNNNSLSIPMKGKIYYFKMYNNDTLIKYFIPCYRNSDNELGMYDIVENQFYTNAGAGTFTYGQVISGSQEADIDLSSKNLFNPTKAITDSNNSATYRTADGEWIRFTTGAQQLKFYPTNIKENTQYTFKVIYKSGVSNSNRIMLTAFYTDGTYKRLVDYTTTDTNEHTTTATTDSGKTLSYIQSGNTDNRETFIKIEGTMLNEGATALDYVPYYDYGEYCKIGNYEDKFIRTSGKNLIPFTNQDFTLNSVHYFVQDGSLYLNGTSSGETLPTNSNFKTNLKFTLEAGTYTFSRVETTIPCYIYKYSDDTRLLLLSGTSLSGTFTLNEKTDVYLSFYVYQNTLSNMFSGIMISKDGGEYEPYGNGTWYIKKNIEHKNYNGSETWDLAGSYDTYIICIRTESNMKLAPLTISNRFETSGDNYLAGSTSTQGRVLIKVQNDLVGVQEGDNNTQKRQRLQTWLSNNNTDFFYQMLTPTYTQITGTLAEQLENVYQKMLSYLGTTNISQVNNDLSFNLSVQAIEDLA